MKKGPLRALQNALCLALLSSFGALALSHAETAAASASTTNQEMYPADLLQISSTGAFSKYVLLVDKSERKLMVFERDGETIRKIDEVPADIGKNDGDKTRENDHKTPEGIYFFQQKLSPPEIPFSLYGKMAFTTDYPNLFDRRLKKTGSGIWLHSIPDSVPLTRGSRGCVVIRNEALEKIESYIRLKQTPMIVYDKMEFITKAEHDRRRREMGQWLEDWKSAWESMDAERYLSHYDEGFSAPSFRDLDAWERHKKRLLKTYSKIKVTLSQPFLLLHRDQLIVKTLQKYESDLHTDYGVKTIHAIRHGQGYKILREEWVRANDAGETATRLSELPFSASHLQD